jgi:2-phospho-L-lactate transferase/gluconeogenesis factor (CofD/UPF0052 family)
MITEGKTILALSGGVGGAKLALGLADVLPPEALAIMVNTGDDFCHLGLHISPDIDSADLLELTQSTPAILAELVTLDILQRA